MEERAKNIIKEIFKKAAPGLVVISAVMLLYYTTDIFKATQPTIIETPEIKPSDFPDYEAFKSMDKKLVLAENQESYSPKGKPVFGRINKIIKPKGEFSRVYLYVESSVDNGKPLSQWDSVYMSLGYVGGHLFRPNSLKFPGDTITRLLYGANQIPFLETIPYSDNGRPVSKDWFLLFQSNKNLYFDAFLSTLRQGGKINLIEIRYQCEVGSECSITAEDTKLAD